MPSHGQWLLNELPRWVEAGLVDAAAADRLRRHYAAAAVAHSGWGRLLFPVLGALLVGLGVILLIAHNWDQLSRGLRLGVAFAPLAAGQLACGWVLWRGAGSRAWAEASAVFTALAFAAALALVGQIYHFPGDLDRYLLTCSLAALPLVYLLGSSVVAVLVAAGLTGWALAAPAADASLAAVLAAFALLLPHLWRVAQREGAGWRWTLLTTACGPLFFVATLDALPHVPRLGLWWLAEFGAICALVELRATTSPGLLRQRPHAVYGTLAVAGAALAGSFPEIWREWRAVPRPDELPGVWLFLVGGLAVLAVLAWRQLRKGRRLAAALALPALLMAGVAPLEGTRMAVLMALLLTGYVLLLGLAAVRAGVRMREPAVATRGLLLITVLVLLRFLDTQWSFTARGVAFVLVGSAFIIASLWLRRQVRR